PMWLNGYGNRNKPSEGKLHDLWVKAIALEDTNGKTAVAVHADLLGIPKEVYDSLCKKIEAKTGLGRDDLMLTVTHTHTGPVLAKALSDLFVLDAEQQKRVDDYTDELETMIVDTVVKAMADRKPATLWAGQGATDFAVNRRNNSEAQVPKIRKAGGKLKGPVDHDVPVLAVRAPDGKLRAVFCGYACHSTTLSYYKWAGDYSGFTQIALEKNHPGAQAMFFIGCGADQNPIPRRSEKLCEKYGHMLAKAVEDVLAKPMRPVVPKLKTAYEQISLAYGSQPGKADLAKRAKADNYQGRRAKRMLAMLEAGKKFPKTYEGYPIQAWKLGDEQLWITMGGEVVVDYALKFKGIYGKNTWITGYANDCMSYIPSDRVRKEGGYEAAAFHVYGLPADTWAPGIEEKITACVDRLVKQVN
ncbi:MAG: neutral/alkaline non-lysosomal ceramidase N-terminal domain-containing protein, partial [Chloroflexota bacterium]|nr:neutral/alkaline non-lysosomal ceramidase N-terminal domain-containing protein [Chloroflexota bacterium]